MAFDTSKPLQCSELIGIPFEYGGRSLEKLDCYGLAIELYRRNGIILPDHRSPSDTAEIAAMMACDLHLWKEVEKPRPGTIAFIRIGRYRAHVGVCLDDMRMIHTWENSGGVVIERLQTWQRHIVGYHEYVG